MQNPAWVYACDCPSARRHQGPVQQLAWFAPAYPSHMPGAHPGSELDTGTATPTPAAPPLASDDPSDPSATAFDSSTAAADPVDGAPLAPPQQHQQHQQGAGRAQPRPQQRAGGSDHQAALHATCQMWRLVSCGAEGRLLTWQLPSLHEWAAGGGGGGGGGAGGAAGGGPQQKVQHAADRAGRWGAAAAAAAAPAPDIPNDVSCCASGPRPPHLLLELSWRAQFLASLHTCSSQRPFPTVCLAAAAAALALGAPRRAGRQRRWRRG